MSKLSEAFSNFKNASWTFRVGAVAFIVGMLFGGCVCREWRKAVIEEQPPTHGMGWVDSPDYVNRVVATFRNPFFGDAAKTIIEADQDKDALLWLCHKKVTGKAWLAHDQNGTGCCVGEGFSTAVEILTAVGIIINNEAHEYHDISASAVYALSREVGNYLVNNDGSTGADAAKSLMEYGCISCDEAGDDNRTNPKHAQTAKKWGKSGLSADLKRLAAAHKIRSAARVRTPEEVRAALINGYPVPICSSVGFEPFRRNDQGLCKPGGSWPHCMCIVGYRADRKHFLVLQSWGESVPPGPKSMPVGYSADDQPNCSFWIDWNTCQRIVSSGESYALSSFDGYPARNIDNFIMVPQQKRATLVRSLLPFSLPDQRSLSCVQRVFSPSWF